MEVQDQDFGLYQEEVFQSNTCLWEIKNSSFLQNTIKIKGLENYESPIIVCNEEHRFITAEQLRQIKIKTSAIILEPSSQNTAPAIAVSALRAIKDGEDPILLVLP